MGSRETLEGLRNRFYENFRIHPISGCWEWVGYFNAYGRGRFKSHHSLGMGTEMASRVTWIIHRGPIPRGINVLHQCDNPSCVNPDHLFLGTQAENMFDAIKKGRHKTPPPRRGESNGMAKLTQAEVDLIRCSGKKPRELAQEFKLSLPQVYNILGGRSWKNSNDG